MDILKAIRNRKSTRGFESREISERDLNVITEAANEAPTGKGAFENIHMTVVRNREILKKIGDIAARNSGKEGFDPFYGAPVVIFVSTKEVVGSTNIQYANAACLVENMCLAATDLGLGSVYIWGVLPVFQSNPELLSELQLEDGFYPASAIALGYPTQEEVEKPKRERRMSINYID